ncbi:hypothetical protein RSK20926_20705 [Roseobacter sp. SK209-2-6]|uniref:hypothetical protein n=1 Tax=Roseobacter sp. SK209-2-6 TaxID=388739 RepID=UPI0000F3E818|nr:hypothetical protein [Roseobacter sp. SK209-2-6]EBA16185.1 hypothetical protein RSK20926_20705 [Roseobacter sp. SK209-2-6]
MLKKAIPTLGSCCLALLLTACNTVPLDAPLQVSGPLGTNFNADEAQCRSEARRVGQGHIGQTAAIGGVGGALVGSIESSDDALAGAVIGAAIGAAAADAEVKQARRQYLVRCMQQRGHPVTG